jgi:hypothetical protein
MKYLKSILSAAFLSFASICLFAQNNSFNNLTPMEMAENQPIVMNGMSVVYIITSTGQKDVGKKGDFSRYEVQISVTNEGGCDWIRRFTGDEKSTAASEFPIGRIECTNATGYRLTSKFQEITPEPFYAYYKQNVVRDGKTVEEKKQVLAGYTFDRGKRRDYRQIFIVPLGEKPKIQCRFFQ